MDIKNSFPTTQQCACRMWTFSTFRQHLESHANSIDRYASDSETLHTSAHLHSILLDYLHHTLRSARSDATPGQTILGLLHSDQTKAEQLQQQQGLEMFTFLNEAYGLSERDAQQWASLDSTRSTLVHYNMSSSHKTTSQRRAFAARHQAVLAHIRHRNTLQTPYDR